tara:strand:- start:132 stop:383 length:252 start_codon:yes stop_codon:yes gene_type:complete
MYPNKGGATTPAMLNPVDTKPKTFPISVGGASERMSMSLDGEITPEKNPAQISKAVIVTRCRFAPARQKNMMESKTKQLAAKI